MASPGPHRLFRVLNLTLVSWPRKARLAFFPGDRRGIFMRRKSFHSRWNGSYCLFIKHSLFIRLCAKHFIWNTLFNSHRRLWEAPNNVMPVLCLREKGSQRSRTCQDWQMAKLRFTPMSVRLPSPCTGLWTVVLISSTRLRVDLKEDLLQSHHSSLMTVLIQVGVRGLSETLQVTLSPGFGRKSPSYCHLSDIIPSLWRAYV